MNRAGLVALRDVLELGARPSSWSPFSVPSCFSIYLFIYFGCAGS